MPLAAISSRSTTAMYPRWNPDNPTPSSPSHASRASIDAARTPTPSRRTNAHLASTVFAVPPPSRASVAADHARPPHAVPGACETKQTAFEWPVTNVRQLHAQLEAEDTDDDDVPRHEILSGDGAYFDDLAYKIHIVILQDDAPPPAEPSVVLAVIALWAKYSDIPAHDEFERQVFVGIKPFERLGERALGEPNWIWSTNATVAFSKRNEYWETSLPLLSTLLENSVISDRDAFSIRIVVKHASEPGLPPLVHTDQQYISRRVTRMFGALLDSVRTGDVRFVCLEHAPASSTPIEPCLARRRVIYAHSELLVQCEYFKAALAGGFAEGADSPVTTLLVDDASFSTVYWVLRWLYTDEILFSATESVRTVMGQVRVNKAAARRVLALASWEYHPLEDDDEDVRTVRSVSSIGTATSGRSVPASIASTSANTSRRPSATTSPSDPHPQPASPAAARPPTRPNVSVSSPTPTPTTLRAPSVAREPKKPTKVIPAPSPPKRAPFPTTTPRRVPTPPDPHVHPTPPPAPPAPLAVFYLAHRYGLEELQAIARDALLAQLTPDNCVAALLASFAFEGLHAAILDYVHEHWQEVSGSPELDRCYHEVSSGIWGEQDGGQVLLGLTRRLTGMSV